MGIGGFKPRKPPSCKGFIMDKKRPTNLLSFSFPFLCFFLGLLNVKIFCLLIKPHEVFTCCELKEYKNVYKISRALTTHAQYCKYLSFASFCFSCVSPLMNISKSNKQKVNKFDKFLSITQTWTSDHFELLKSWGCLRACMCSDLTCDSFWRLWQLTCTLVPLSQKIQNW